MSDIGDIDLEKIRNWPKGKVGYVALVGRPNVGKSTFLNAVLDYHLAAVSIKPQTTRRNCIGVLSDESSQIIFVDTPGAHRGRNELGKAMLRSVMQGLDDVDVILCLADPTRPPGEEDKLVAERVANAGKPTFLLLNKTDLTKPTARAEMEAAYREYLGADTPHYNIVATDPATLDPILDDVRQRLPDGPFFYEADQMTDVYLRDLGAEMIRESLLELLREEIPHSCFVEVDEWKERGDRLRVKATVHVEAASQKGIVVGKGGKMIRGISKDAAGRIADLLDDEIRVDVELHVKVSKDWRNRKAFLKDHGLR